jgi:hypothetical protein
MASTRLSEEKAEIDIMDTASINFMEDTKSILKDSSSVISTEDLIRYESNDVEFAGRPQVIANMEEIALKALHIDDDPTLNPWTFRMFLLGNPSCVQNYMDSY